MNQEEALQRLLAIDELCQKALTNGRPMLTYEWDLLRQIQHIAQAGEGDIPVKISEAQPQLLDHIILSCDASITKNPGGQVAVGAVIQYKDEDPIEMFRKIRKSNTNNQGEYDAIYFGLTQLMTLKNNPGCPVVVHSDSKLVVDQLNKKIACKDEKLLRKRDNILELIAELPVPVYIEWRPRNSTAALELANNIAQKANGVKPH